MQLMNKLYIIILSLILLLPVSYGYLSGEARLIDTLKPCYGQLLLKVLGDERSDDYVMPGCDKRSDNLWVCNCLDDNTFPIYLKTKAGITNKYEVKAQFYIAPILKYDPKAKNASAYEIENEKYLRIFTYSDIYFSPIFESEKQKAEIAKQQDALAAKEKSVFNWIILFIVIGVLLFAVGGYFIFKKIFHSQENQLEGTTDSEDDVKKQILQELQDLRK
jgi:hypothetical protein